MGITKITVMWGIIVDPSAIIKEWDPELADEDYSESRYDFFNTNEPITLEECTNPRIFALVKLWKMFPTVMLLPEDQVPDHMEDAVAFGIPIKTFNVIDTWPLDGFEDSYIERQAAIQLDRIWEEIGEDIFKVFPGIEGKKLFIQDDCACCS